MRLGRCGGGGGREGSGRGGEIPSHDAVHDAAGHARQPRTCAPKLGEKPSSPAEPSPSTPARLSESLRGIPAERQVAVACSRRCIATCRAAFEKRALHGAQVTAAGGEQ